MDTVNRDSDTKRKVFLNIYFKVVDDDGNVIGREPIGMGLELYNQPDRTGTGSAMANDNRRTLIDFIAEKCAASETPGICDITDDEIQEYFSFSCFDSDSYVKPERESENGRRLAIKARKE